jgi:hypothetical protein
MTVPAARRTIATATIGTRIRTVTKSRPGMHRMNPGKIVAETTRAIG